MTLDAALSADTKTQILVGLGVAVSSDGGATFVKNEDLRGSSQGVYTYGDKKDLFAVVGDMESKSSKVSISGVATSSDGSSFKLSAPVPEGFARYASFPSETTWFVSQGIWDTR